MANATFLITEGADQSTLEQIGVSGTHLLTAVLSVVPASHPEGAFMVANRLSELTTPQSKVDARTNLELQHIDCGVFL